MSKLILTTVETVVRRYYVETDVPLTDKMVENHNIEEFSSISDMEEVCIDIREVEEFPTCPKTSVNGAVNKWDGTTQTWIKSVRWDLAV